MRVECLTDDAAFDALREEWNALLSAAVTDTVFLQWYWQRAWWRAYREGKELRLLTARDGRGRLVGVAPLFRHEMVVPVGSGLLPSLSIERPDPPSDGVPVRFLHLIGGTELSDYLDLIVERENAPTIIAALFRQLVEMGDWDILDLHDVPAASTLLQTLQDLARMHGLSVALAQEEVCPVVALPEDMDTYLESLSKKDRHELRRKIRRAHMQAQVSWRKTESAEELRYDLELFFRLHEASTPEKAGFWDDRARAFFCEIAHALQADGRLELSFLTFDGRPVATYFCFIGGTEVPRDYLVYNSGFDPSYYRQSPGLVLCYYLIQDAIARRFRRFDFLRGDERYKYDLGGVDQPIYRLAIALA